MKLKLNTEVPHHAAPALQFINSLLHKPPFSFISYGCVWTFILLVVSPLAGCALLMWTLIRTLAYIVLLPFGNNPIDPKRKTNQELAVLITGCDSGFGLEVTYELARLGFTVFAGCLKEESFQKYQGESRIIPVKMDVTQDEQVTKVASLVSKWLEEGNENGERFLHAIVNNAGVGHMGLVDWVEMKEFYTDMEVNYFGTVRTVKAFLPLIKSQAIQGLYNETPRIVNMVSTAGLVASPTSSTYHGSKFAAEAFSSCLRLELRRWGVKVTTVNPSLHETPLTRNMGNSFNRLVSSLPSEKYEEYGEDFFRQFFKNSVELPASITWDAEEVVQGLVSCVNSKHPPPQLALGMDTRYCFLLIRHLPVWLQDLLVQSTQGGHLKPAALYR